MDPISERLFSEPLFTFKRGDHVCVFYHDESAMLDVLVPYIFEGLALGEQCLCVLPPQICQRFVAGLKAAGVDTDREIRQRALVVHPPEEVYFPSGDFQAVAMIALLGGAIAEAGRLGFSGFRSAGELSWAAHGRCDCDRLVEYEAMVDAAYPKQGATGMCLYDMKQFPEAVLGKVLEVHRLCLNDSVGASKRCSVGIRHGAFFADIVVDRADRSRFYYVAQKSGCADVLGWGYAPNFEVAMHCSERLLSEVANG
jgi:MEDS: MEthanogen/methylotroph, DcmR Sensory domain